MYDKKIYTSRTKRWEIWLDQRNGLFVAHFLPFNKDGYSDPFDEPSMWRLREIIRTDGDDKAIEYLELSFEGIYVVKNRYFPNHWAAYQSLYKDGVLKAETMLESGRHGERLAAKYGLELPYRPRFYATVETLERFIRSKKSLPDFLHFQGKTWEMNFYDQDGKLVTYGVFDDVAKMEIRIHTTDRYKNGIKDATVEIFEW